VLLDEPSTGLDPVSVRQIYHVLNRARIGRRGGGPSAGRALLLITHSMAEAAHLASRVAIMAHGQLIAIGTERELCRQYGGGYRLTITHSAGRGDEAEQDIASAIPGARLITQFVRSRKYELDAGARVSAVFRTMIDLGKRGNIEEWGVAMATLEDAFTNLVEPNAAVNIAGLLHDD
jgi:ABC-type multidrug transport system ATPase subunit